MPTHNLFEGGQKNSSRFPENNLYPSTEPGLNENMESDQRRTSVVYSNTRMFDFNDERPSLGMVDAGSGLNSPMAYGSTALRHYLRLNDIVAGDIIATHILPRFSMLEWVHWSVDDAITPFTFDIQVRGQAASVGAPVVLAAGVDGSVLASGLIDVKAINGGAPMYFDQNDILEIVINSLPADGIKGANFSISPVLMEFVRGVSA